ncbi:MAG: adenosylmethionine--8-amino-7-oxononanoate transaminase [Bacteroidales bacterium]|nr:adenosylmethionine--8-amino-7-oxononanoate transaminase [Bacteroidales bacterium]
MNSKLMLEYDKNHIWHPYTSMTKPLPVQLVESANGYEIKLADGKKLIDGMSSWWAAIHGYNNKVLNQAITNQLNKMAHIMFGGLTHQPAVDLANKLIEITPVGLEHVFFSDSGSVSVEVAMKMALQYWQSKQEYKKTEFATIQKGYHGDTWHAMSVCDPTTGMHSLFEEGLPKQNFVSEPKVTFYEEWNQEDLSEMHELLLNKEDTIAAVIVEPIVQGAGGMRFYHPQYLLGLKELCTKYNVLLIADEIATGFGRTGELFACNFENITPDILCLGKAITGGYMSFAATLTTSDVAHTISKGEPGVFMHGPTFMGNPLACAVANASIDLLLSQDWKSNIRRIEERLKVGLEPAKQFSQVADVRVLGAIGVIELKKQVDMAKIQAAFIEKGIWIRPFGKLVYTMPPYIIDNDALDKITSGMVEVVRN